MNCYKLPIPLTVCPCCGEGVKQSRGFTWINSALFSSAECGEAEKCRKDLCPANMQNVRMGLLWVGEKFYPTADAFEKESYMQGISKRISQVPREFVIGETWIALAHPKAVNAIGEGGTIQSAPGIFSLFRPMRIEYVVTGKETQEELERLEER